MVLIVQLADFTTSGQAVVKNVMRFCTEIIARGTELKSCGIREKRQVIYSYL